MAVELRPLSPDLAEAMVRNDARAFAVPSRDVAPMVARLDQVVETERFVVAVEDGSVVGNAGAFTMELTLPGGAMVPVAGVTWVAVAATHHRRGVMRSMMEWLAGGARERGEVALVLIASEGGIYGRVGFGAATRWHHTRIDPRRAVLRDDVVGRGTVRYVEVADAPTVLAPFHDRVRRLSPGEVSRPEVWWRGHGPADVRAPSDHVVVVEDPPGDPVAAASYRVRDRWGDGHPAHLVTVDHLGALDPAASATLWRFLLSIDLVGEVRTTALPPDHPLPLWLADPRQVRTVERNDGLWVRFLDVAAFLGARDYDVADELVVEVVSADPVVDGRWLLVGGPEGAEVARTGRAADLATDDATLAAVGLGGASVRQAAAAGRIGERTPGAVARLARFLRWDPEPFCGTNF